MLPKIIFTAMVGGLAAWALIRDGVVRLNLRSARGPTIVGLVLFALSLGALLFDSWHF